MWTIQLVSDLYVVVSNRFKRLRCRCALDFAERYPANAGEDARNAASIIIAINSGKDLEIVRIMLLPSM